MNRVETDNLRESPTEETQKLHVDIKNKDPGRDRRLWCSMRSHRTMKVRDMDLSKERGSSGVRKITCNQFTVKSTRLLFTIFYSYIVKKF